MLERFAEVKSYTIRLYPHKHPTLGFVWASVSYEYDETLTDREWAWVSFAPRFANALVLPCALFLDISTTPWLFFLMGGIIDLIRGSTINRETADIRYYSKGFNIPLRSLISAQLVYALCSLLALAQRVWY